MIHRKIHKTSGKVRHEIGKLKSDNHLKESGKVKRMYLGDQMMQLKDYAYEAIQVIYVNLLTREEFCRDKVFKVMTSIQPETSLFFAQKYKEIDIKSFPKHGFISCSSRFFPTNSRKKSFC